MLSDTYGQTARREPSDKQACRIRKPTSLAVPSRRLSAEQIRDAMLFTSGE